MLPPKAWKKCLHKNTTENLDIVNYSIEEIYRSSVLETLHKDGFLPSLKNTGTTNNRDENALVHNAYHRCLCYIF